VAVGSETPTVPANRDRGHFLGQTVRMAIRARRCEATEDPGGLGGSDYAGAFEVTIALGDDRSPEQWSRSVFESAPTAIRWFVLFGWRFVLGLRLGPQMSPDYVSGWRIRDVGPSVITLEVDSWLMTASKEIRVAGGSVRVSTFVRYSGGLGRAAWTLVAPVHHRTEPYLLGYAASHRT
jgi:Protein of unknown function (DUF2867)